MAVAADNADIWRPGSNLLVNANNSVGIQFFTASANQQDFTLTNFEYVPGTNSLFVAINGVVQRVGIDFLETDSTHFHTDTPLPATTIVTAFGFTEVALSASVDSLIRPQLAAVTGAAMIGWIQSGAHAAATTLNARVRQLKITPKDFGAIGDGVVDDTIALQEFFADGRAGEIPSDFRGLFSDTLIIGADVDCYGVLIAAAGFNKTAVTFSDPGFTTIRKIKGLNVLSTSTRTALSYGIVINYPNIFLENCITPKFDYGIVVASYNAVIFNCSGQLCNTGLSAYAPTSGSEINNLAIIGGSYDSNTDFGLNIGDPRWATAVAPGNPYGVVVNVFFPQVTAATGVGIAIDRIFAANIQMYLEGPGSGKAIVVGGTGNGNVRNLTIGPDCYMSRWDYGIYLNNAVRGLTISPNYYNVNYCALYAVNCDVFGFEYYTGSSNGFPGPEVHTGFTNTTIDQIVFNSLTIDQDNLNRGVQRAYNKTTYENWYPYAQSGDGWVLYNSASCRFHKTPVVINGTMAASVFTCTTLADALKFNGGDRVTCSIGGGITFVRSVNYATGQVTVNGATAGACTLSTITAEFLGLNLFGAGTPEGAIVAPVGSRFSRIDGGAGTCLYVKESGTGNVGWVGK